MFNKLLATIMLAALSIAASAQSWTADNGNGTYTNPLFYDEFSDPDIIRVGDDYYLAGTTMHCLPGLVVLHSRDLVNWDFASYCLPRFDMGDEFRLENHKEAYGQGIWAPCIRYHNGKFYIFSNINGHGLQVFISEKATGPWKHINMKGAIYDLSVLFDDDKIYCVYGYGNVKIIELKPDFSGFVEGSERTIIPEGSAMGEGHHIYKINGKYYILSADYAPMGRMMCARADNIDGPYEVRTISSKESMGIRKNSMVDNPTDHRQLPGEGYEFRISRNTGNGLGNATIHQGGIVSLPNGDWWGVSMQDFAGVGRTTSLSPVTWHDGWPYFGIEGNLGRSPKTWTKPATGATVEPHAPYDRNDDFTQKTLKPIWQWNHEPVDKQWTTGKGELQLQTMPAENLLWAKNTLTQRIIGPVASATTVLDFSQLKDGDRAGLGLLNIPFAWLGVNVEGNAKTLRFYNQNGNITQEMPIKGKQVTLRITANLDDEMAQFSYSNDGTTFQNVGDSVLLPYQLKTFQGARYALFAYNTKQRQGGKARFCSFRVDEPMADRSKNIPYDKIITLRNIGNDELLWANPHGIVHGTNSKNAEFIVNYCLFRVLDRGNGKVVLQTSDGSGYLTVVGLGLCGDVRITKEETEGSLFMWQDMLRSQCMLLSLVTNRYVGVDPTTGESYSATWEGTTPDRKNGTVFSFSEE